MAVGYCKICGSYTFIFKIPEINWCCSDCFEEIICEGKAAMKEIEIEKEIQLGEEEECAQYDFEPHGTAPLDPDIFPFDTTGDFWRND